MRPRRMLAPALTCAAALLAVGAAHANTFASTELSYDNALLSQFNLVNLGNFSSNGQTIQGRAIIGGNYTTSGTETVCSGTGCAGNTTLGVSSTTATGVVNATSSTSNSTSSANPNYGYGALTVFGSVTGATNIVNGGDFNIKGNDGGSTSNMNGKGGLNIAGTVTSGSTVNSPTEIRATSAATAGSYTGTAPTSYEANDTIAQVFAPFANANAVANNLATPLKNLSAGLANLPGSPGVKADVLNASGVGTYTSTNDYTANGLTYGVVTTTVAALAAANTKFTGIANGSGNAATFVIVSGDGANAILPTLTNTDSKVIYDFVGATTLKLGGDFDASILAPLATLTTTGTGLVNGTVVVASMTQSQALFSGNAFTGSLAGLTSFGYNARVPEPASLTLMGAGVVALAALRRRRKR